MKTKLFNTILDVVSEVTEVEKCDILSLRKDDEILEARILFVWFCDMNGLHVADIAKFLGRKSPSSITDKIRDYHAWSARYEVFRYYVKKIALVLPARLEQVIESDIPTT